jgi:hypothetical protein
VVVVHALNTQVVATGKPEVKSGPNSMPKPGGSQQYEAGRKKHMQFHRDQKDTWTWNTFAIETGDNAGMFVTSS